MFSPTRIMLAACLAIAALGLATAPAGGERSTPGATAAGGLDENPCLERATRRKLLCPDLTMSPPENLYLTRSRKGRLRLHAGNSINSIGKGPAELRGRRSSRWLMRAKQTIYKRGGGFVRLRTGARLGFKAIPGQYRYWKFTRAARFELWRLDEEGRRTKLVRTGPKVSYCLRDLQRRNPQLRRSPERFHYPACSQDLRKKRVTIGTSVGWSDVYPSTYYEQYLFVDKLRGCFAYVHRADPKNGIYETNEDNNEGERIVRLPWKGGRKGCPAHSVDPDPPPDGEDDGGTQAP